MVLPHVGQYLFKINKIKKKEKSPSRTCICWPLDFMAIKSIAKDSSSNLLSPTQKTSEKTLCEVHENQRHGKARGGSNGEEEKEFKNFGTTLSDDRSDGWWYSYFDEISYIISDIKSYKLNGFDL